MTAIPAILTATPAITLPATAAVETLNDANVELGLVDNVAECWTGPRDDEELSVFFCHGRVWEKTSTRSK